jgi:hypothetical protein
MKHFKKEKYKGKRKQNPIVTCLNVMEYIETKEGTVASMEPIGWQKFRDNEE